MVEIRFLNCTNDTKWPDNLRALSCLATNRLK